MQKHTLMLRWQIFRPYVCVTDNMERCWQSDLVVIRRVGGNLSDLFINTKGLPDHFSHQLLHLYRLRFISLFIISSHSGFMSGFEPLYEHFCTSEQITSKKTSGIMLKVFTYFVFSSKSIFNVSQSVSETYILDAVISSVSYFSAYMRTYKRVTSHINLLLWYFYDAIPLFFNLESFIHHCNCIESHTVLKQHERCGKWWQKSLFRPSFLSFPHDVLSLLFSCCSNEDLLFTDSSDCVLGLSHSMSVCIRVYLSPAGCLRGFSESFLPPVDLYSLTV